MRKVMVTICAAAVTFILLSGCSSQEAEGRKNAASGSSAGSAATQPASVENEGKSSLITASVEFNPEYDADIMGIRIDMEMEETEKILGKPEKSEKHREEAFGGDVVENTYNFGVIRFEPVEDKYYIGGITIDKPGFKGPRDIEVGMDVQTVMEKFPYNKNAAANEDGSKYLYGSNGMNNGTAIYDENGKVTGLVYTYGEGGFGSFMLRITVEDDKVKSVAIHVINI